MEPPTPPAQSRAHKARHHRSTSRSAKSQGSWVVTVFTLLVGVCFAVSIFYSYIIHPWVNNATTGLPHVSCPASNITIVQAASPQLPVDLSSDNISTCACAAPPASFSARSPNSSTYRRSYRVPPVKPRSELSDVFPDPQEPPAPRVPLPPAAHWWAYAFGQAKRPRFRQAVKERLFGLRLPIYPGHWFFLGVMNASPDPDEVLYGVQVSDANQLDLAACQYHAHRDLVMERRTYRAKRAATITAERAHAQVERRAMQQLRRQIGKMYVEAVWMMYRATPVKDTDLVVYRENPYNRPFASKASHDNWQQFALLTLAAAVIAYADVKVLRLSSSSSLLDDDESDDANFQPSDEDIDRADEAWLAPKPSNETTQPSAPISESLQEVIEAVHDEHVSPSPSGSVPGAYAPVEVLNSEEEVQTVSAVDPPTASPVVSAERATVEVVPPASVESSTAIVDTSDVELDHPASVDPSPASTVTTATADDDLAEVSDQLAASSILASLPVASPPDDYKVESIVTATSGRVEEPISAVCNDANEVEEPTVTPPSPPALSQSSNSAGSPSVLPSVVTEVPSDTDESWTVVDNKKKRNMNALPNSTRPTCVAAHLPGSSPSLTGTSKVRNRRGKGHGKGNRNIQPAVAQASTPSLPRTFAPIKPAGDAWGLGKSTEIDKKVELDCGTIGTPHDTIAALQAVSQPMSICPSSSVQSIFNQESGSADVDMVCVGPATSMVSPSTEGSSSFCMLTETDDGERPDLASIIVQALPRGDSREVSPIVSNASRIYGTVMESVFMRGTAMMDVDMAPVQSTSSYQFSTPPVSRQLILSNGNAPSVAKSTGTGKRLKLNDAPVAVSNVVPAALPSVAVPVSDLTPKIDNDVMKPFCIRGTAPVDVDMAPVQPVTSYRFLTPAAVPGSHLSGSREATTSSVGKSTGNGKKQRVNNSLATSRHAPVKQSSSASLPYTKPVPKRPASPSFVTGKNADKGKGKQVDSAPTEVTQPVHPRKKKYDNRRAMQRGKKRSSKATEATASTSASTAVAEDTTLDVEMPIAQESDVSRETEDAKSQTLAQAAKTAIDDEFDVEDLIAVADISE